MKKLPIYIGYDKAEPVAYHTCVESILDTCSVPVEITPLYKKTLQFADPKTLPGYKPSNGFIFSRFLVPYLQGWSGTALFLDGDMVVLSDIAELFELNMAGLGARVVKHDYKTSAQKKYLNSTNADYIRKNWSSVILWNCNFFPHRQLTPEAIANGRGDYLHRFAWLDDAEIGELDPRWNVLADEPNQANHPKLVHYTLGTPCFPDYQECEYAGYWHAYRESVNSCADR